MDEAFSTSPQDGGNISPPKDPPISNPRQTHPDDIPPGLESLQLNTRASPDENRTKQASSAPQTAPVPQTQTQPPSFSPIENPPPRLTLPDNQWTAILESPCTFPADIFSRVMLNLIRNPNITSSHLFRADILYDSEVDPHSAPRHGRGDGDGDGHSGANGEGGSLVPHLKACYRPRCVASDEWAGMKVERTMVRELIPRNPRLDRAMVQSCYFLRGRGEGGVRVITDNDDDDDDDDDDDEGREEDEREQSQTLVLYVPHADTPSEIPFYHPTLSQLAFLHTSSTTPSSASYITILYRPFHSHPLDTKLSRTALALLRTIHKHGQGSLAGYKKRVTLDTLIPQKTYQDTYTRLKAKYARQLSEKWVEVTDPGKHVFEDLGIAAYLIELWREMYGEGENEFPGFVDIGCGNGVLVNILVEEGYEGWGFDARERKTWGIFPPHVRRRLERRVLVPSVLGQADETQTEQNGLWHDGMFKPGTFIVSNHADELTPWTPLLAYLNDSAFLAIPCCSHDLAGARFRAPATTRAAKETAVMSRLPQQEIQSTTSGSGQSAETGSLKRTEAQKKMPSAYSTLCSYVSSLAVEVGFQPDTDVLRIPSTRNSAIIGRRRRSGDVESVDKRQIVIDIVEQELRCEISTMGKDWIDRAEKLIKKPSSGH